MSTPATPAKGNLASKNNCSCCDRFGARNVAASTHAAGKAVRRCLSYALTTARRTLESVVARAPAPGRVHAVGAAGIRDHHPPGAGSAFIHFQF